MCLQEAVTIIHVLDLHLLVLDALEFIELLDPVGEGEREEASLVLRRRKSIDPPTTNDPRPPLIEEESPLTVVAGVFVELAPQEEVVESDSGAGFEAMGPKVLPSTPEEGGALVEAPVEQVQVEVELAEKMHKEVALVKETPVEAGEEAAL